MSGGSSLDAKANLIASYLRHAYEDIDAAKALGDKGNHYEPYHIEQGVEKAILALLVAEDIHVNTRVEGHLLDVTSAKIPDANPYKTRLADLAFLKDYSTTFRYPRPTSGRVNRIVNERVLMVRDARNKAETIILELGRHFGVNLAFNLNSPAQRTDPPRSGPAPKSGRG